MRGIWKTWLYLWCLAGFALGVVLALAAFPATDAPARIIFSSMGAPNGGAGWFASDMLRFAIGLQGSILIGWIITIFGLLRAGDRIGASAWRWVTVAVLIWFVIDSTISVSTNMTPNAVSNLAFLILYLIPIGASGVLRGAKAPSP